jgi:hypothetical protein
MEPAIKRKPLPDSVPEEARRRLSPFKPGPEGPTKKVLKVSVTPKYFDVLKEFRFVKLNIKSNDGKFSVSAILKNRTSFLELVPMRIPPIDIIMELRGFQDNVGQDTVFSVEDGAGRAMEYLLLAIRPPSGENAAGWQSRKTRYSH